MHFWAIFDQKCLTCFFLGQNFRKTIVVFEIRTLKFTQLQNFMKKQKCLSLGPKLPDLGILGLKFEGRIVIFEISTFEFVCLQSFGLEFQRSQICQNESLTHTVNVSIEPAFSEGLGPNPVLKYASNNKESFVKHTNKIQTETLLLFISVLLLRQEFVLKIVLTNLFRKFLIGQTMGLVNNLVG